MLNVNATEFVPEKHIEISSEPLNVHTPLFDHVKWIKKTKNTLLNKDFNEVNKLNHRTYQLLIQETDDKVTNLLSTQRKNAVIAKLFSHVFASECQTCNSVDSNAVSHGFFLSSNIVANHISHIEESSKNDFLMGNKGYIISSCLPKVMCTEDLCTLLTLEFINFVEAMELCQDVATVGYKTWLKTVEYSSNSLELNRVHAFFVLMDESCMTKIDCCQYDARNVMKSLQQFSNNSVLFNDKGILKLGSMERFLQCRKTTINIHIIIDEQSNMEVNENENSFGMLHVNIIDTTNIDVADVQLLNVVSIIKKELEAELEWNSEKHIYVVLQNKNEYSDQSYHLTVRYIVHILIKNFSSICNITIQRATLYRSSISSKLCPANIDENKITQNECFTLWNQQCSEFKESTKFLSHEEFDKLSVFCCEQHNHIFDDINDDNEIGALSNMTDKIMELDTFKFMLEIVHLYTSELAQIDQIRGVFANNYLECSKEIITTNINIIAEMCIDNKFSACRRPVGVEVLLCVDHHGACFVIDKAMRSFLMINQLPRKLSSIMHDSVFSAVLTLTSLRCGTIVNEHELRIVITDVYILQAHELYTLPFSERWRYLNMCRIDDEIAWPHATYSNHVVILKALYVPLEEIKLLYDLPVADYATLGIFIRSNYLIENNNIVCRCDDDGLNSEAKNTESVDKCSFNESKELREESITQEMIFVWLPAESITVYFRAGKVENVQSDDEDNNNSNSSERAITHVTVKRVYLQVRNGKSKIILNDKNKIAKVQNKKSDSEQTKRYNSECSVYDVDGHEVEEKCDHFDDYFEEYADYDELAYPELHEGSVVECICNKNSNGSHWWSVLRIVDVTNASNLEIASVEYVNKVISFPYVDESSVCMLPHAKLYMCKLCNRIDLTGQVSEANANDFRCNKCWKEMGYGNCNYCKAKNVKGAETEEGELFYCEKCWFSFTEINRDAEIGYFIPPPANSSYYLQVRTRTICLLIDLISSKYCTDDVLEMCCDAAVPRKWMHNMTHNYIGVVQHDSTNEACTNDTEFPVPNLPLSHYERVYANCFAENFWSEVIAKIHPHQFHVVTCFLGFPQALCNEDRIRHFVGSIANALVPGGVFIGMFVDAETLFGKGNNYVTSICSACWDEEAKPQLGNVFHFTTNEHEKNTFSVIPVDFLVAVAAEFNLHTIPTASVTLAELIKRDSSWAQSSSSDEKEYLSLVRAFAFTKIVDRKADNKNNIINES